MKRFVSVFALSALCSMALTAPAKAHALSWDWLPKLFQVEEAPENPIGSCSLRNSLGGCVMYNMKYEHPRTIRHLYHARSSFEYLHEPMMSKASISSKNDTE